MFASFKEDRVTQPLYRSTASGRARRLSPKAELSRLSGFLIGVRATLREWRQRRNGRLELARFDERMLRDIGLTRVDADYEINKPFWRE